LLERVHHFHQIALMRHHRVDVFVRSRNFIHHAAIFAAFNTSCLRRKVKAVVALFELVMAVY
jgi:hypothetical protein